MQELELLKIPRVYQSRITAQKAIQEISLPHVLHICGVSSEKLDGEWIVGEMPPSRMFLARGKLQSACQAQSLDSLVVDCHTVCFSLWLTTLTCIMHLMLFARSHA